MKNSQKRVCDGCRAVEYVEDLRCSLGYQTEDVLFLGRTVALKPLEPCPKPKNYTDYLKLLK